MFPGRFWAALGTGEASNEHITGARMAAQGRSATARLRECVDVIRALLAGEEVSHDGLVTVDRARLWTRPDEPPALIGAAVSVETARWCAGWADGLITVNAAGRPPRRDDLRLPRGRRPRTAVPAGARELGADGRGGRGGGVRPVAEQRVPAAGLLGPRD